MSSPFAALRTTAFLACSALVLATPAFAESTLSFKVGNAVQTTGVTGVSMNIARSPAYDNETGMPLPNAPPVVYVSPISISRTADASSAAFLGAAVSGAPMGDVVLKLDGAGSAEWTLQNVTVNNYGSYPLDGVGQTESFDLTYTKAIVKSGGRTIEITPPQE